MTKELRELFPRLVEGEYKVTSGPTREYNCIAWAAGVADAWWEAGSDGYWPSGVPTDGTIEAAVRLFESLGLAPTDNPSLEPGVEKVAIYGSGPEYTHAARQLSDGRWTSKLGELEDIEHDSLDSLSGAAYGSVVRILEKVVAPPSPTLPGGQGSIATPGFTPGQP